MFQEIVFSRSPIGEIREIVFSIGDPVFMKEEPYANLWRIVVTIKGLYGEDDYFEMPGTNFTQFIVLDSIIQSVRFFLDEHIKEGNELYYTESGALTQKQNDLYKTYLLRPTSTEWEDRISSNKE